MERRWTLTSSYASILASCTTRAAVVAPAASQIGTTTATLLVAVGLLVGPILRASWMQRRYTGGRVITECH